tara:strand:- start:19 stop:561 length:543 start_codon:yes stop_codon:yes gene_type:complete
MILNCNSCDKKFVVPDKAITASGRLVQCGSCGSKWKQFPVNEINQTSLSPDTKKILPKNQKIQQKTQRPKKTKKSAVRKSREIDLYSPEYLAKKHGIKLNNGEYKKTTPNNKATQNNKVSLGFYNTLLVFIVLIIFLSRGLYFFQDYVIQKLPFTEFYIGYFFESIRNMFEIWKNLISSY